jgi:hypothetical protein
MLQVNEKKQSLFGDWRAVSCFVLCVNVMKETAGKIADER